MEETYYCTSCGEFHNLDVTKLVEWIDQMYNEKKIALSGNFGNIPDIICPKCGMHKVVHVDSGMKEIIQKFREKNYYTTFCCSGHTDNTAFHTIGMPYVSLRADTNLVSYIIRNEKYANVYNIHLTVCISPNRIDIYPRRGWKINENLPDNKKDAYRARYKQFRQTLIQLINDLPEGANDTEE